jgi:acetoin:2,6-dichlorophenolindophenol oxidoreductase subunit beta
MAKPMSTAEISGAVKEMRVQEALREGLRYEMARDKRVFVMGEDMVLFGGAYGVTRGLLQEFGQDRVLDTPISEAAMVGLAVGVNQVVDAAMRLAEGGKLT